MYAQSVKTDFSGRDAQGIKAYFSGRDVTPTPQITTDASLIALVSTIEATTTSSGIDHLVTVVATLIVGDATPVPVLMNRSYDED